MAGNLIDPNLSYAWTAQQAAGSGNLYGQAGLGYGSVAPVAPAPQTFGTAPNAGAGGGNALSNTGLYNRGNANAAALFNAGYSSENAPFLGLLTSTTQPPVPTPALGARIPNPSGLVAQVNIVGGTLTNVYIGQNGVAGSGTTNLTQVGTGAGTYTVPAAGVIYLAGSVAPTWTWITQN